MRALRQTLRRSGRHGNGGRYAYYVCFTRQRYGAKACDGDRLPAPELEAAILGQLERVLAHEDIVREAIAEAFSELDAERPRREAELQRIDAELRRTDHALGRSFAAFEAGTMAERDCAGRIAELSARLRGLDARREELAVDTGEAPESLGEDELWAPRAHVREVIQTGDPPTRKALLQALVEEIRVVSRAEIYPSFSLPAVRPPSGSARRRGLEPPPDCPGPGRWRRKACGKYGVMQYFTQCLAESTTSYLTSRSISTAT